METINKREALNKGVLVGQKPPVKPKDIRAIRVHLQNAHAVRDLAMFNLVIDSKLRGCDRRIAARVRTQAQGRLWSMMLELAQGQVSEGTGPLDDR